MKQTGNLRFSATVEPLSYLAWIMFCLFVWTMKVDAATCTWEGDDLTNPTYWNDADNWGGTVPVAGDDVVFPAINKECNVNVNTAVLNSLNMTGYTGTLSGTGNISVTCAADAVFTLDGTITNTGAPVLAAASGKVLTCTFDGASTFTGMTIGVLTSGTGTVTFADGLALGTTRTLTFTCGTLKTDGATDNAGLTHSWGAFSSNNTNTRTLTLGTSNITITGTGTAWDMTTYTNLIVSTNTATITLSGADVTGYFGDKTYGGTVAFTGTGIAIVRNNNSFATLTRTGTPSKTDAFQIRSNQIITGTLNINGNSATDRLLVYGATLGTPSTLTVTGATVSTNNVDFRDITFARTTAGGLDLTNGGANLIGDCGGNSRTGGDGTVTFTTSRANNFINVAGGNWADVANWDTATDADRVPLPQDDVTFATAFNSGVTITANMPRLGRSIDFSGATATGAGVLPTFALGNDVTNYGSLNLTGLKASGFTGAYYWYFESQARSGTNYLTSNGKSFPSRTYIQAVGATLQLADALSVPNQILYVLNGTFVDAGFSVTTSRFSSALSAARTVTKTGNWTLNASTAVNVIELSASSLTWSDTAGTITLSDTGSAAKTFAGAGKTFNNLTIAGGGTGAIIFTGNNTFTGTVLVNYPKTIQFADNSIQTAATWTMSGATGAGNTVTIRPVTNDGSAHFHIAKTGGGQAINDYLIVTNSVADTASTFYCGANGSADAFSLANGWRSSPVDRNNRLNGWLDGWLDGELQ